MTTAIEVLDLFQCPDCEALFDEEPEHDPCYECGNCGNEFRRSESEYESHRCDQCGKFASKLADYACEECEAPVDEFPLVKAVETDNGYQTLEDYEEDKAAQEGDEKEVRKSNEGVPNGGTFTLGYILKQHPDHRLYQLTPSTGKDLCWQLTELALKGELFKVPLTEYYVKRGDDLYATDRWTGRKSKRPSYRLEKV